jgi:type IV pilus assembly protein PilA
MQKKNGFSLIEVVVVLALSGLIAAIAIPINSNTTTKAKMSEADVGLRNIRTQLQLHFNQTGAYPTMASGSYVIGSPWHDIESGELTGKYFTDYSYTIESDPISFVITCATGDQLPSDCKMRPLGKITGGA